MHPGTQLPPALQGVSRSILEDYVLARIQQFSKVFASQLAPNAPESLVQHAYTRALNLVGANDTSTIDACRVRFRHSCKFLGCLNKDCQLCKNNPNKRCKDGDNFDECYADNQILRSKCEADVFVEVINQVTGKPESLPGVEFQVTVIDGESYSEGASPGLGAAKDLLKSDEGQLLLGAYLTGCRVDPSGKLFLKPQDGQARLPDVYITDKNDTFRLNGDTFGTFRMMARAVKRDLNGNPVPFNIPPAVSAKFIVKTQRALNDYRKAEYPHFKDELTKLKYIGSITAQRLREIQQHIDIDVPFTSIETVEQLKHLMLYADQNRQVEGKLLELLSMKGKHKVKWDYLREILLEKIVYDDMLHRAWYLDDSMTQGLLFSCKQGQVNLDKPIGFMQRVMQVGQSRLQVITQLDPQETEIVKMYRQAAEDAWNTPSHKGWAVVQEQLELASGSGLSLSVPQSLRTAPSGGLSQATSQAVSAGMSTMSAGPGVRTMSGMANTMDSREEAQMGMYNTTGIPMSPHMADTPSTRHHSAPGFPMQQIQHSMQLPSDYPYQHSGPRPGSAGMPAESFHQSLDTGYHYNTGLHAMLNPQTGEALEVYRTNSAPSIGPNLGDAIDPAQDPEPAMNRPAARSLQATHQRPSWRNRRMSADPAALQELQAQLQAEAAAMKYNQTLDTSMFHKRPRGSAPSGLYPEMDTSSNVPQAVAVDRARLAFYHQESRGRHIPRCRTSQENLSVAMPGMGLPSLFDADDLDRLFNTGMAGTSGGPFAIKQEALAGAGLGLQLGLGAQSGPVLDFNPPRETASGGLSLTMQHQLQLSEPMGHHSVAQHILNAHAGAGSRVLRHSDSDSFNKHINRILTHSDDSFRRFLEPLASPANQPDIAQNFDPQIDHHLMQ